MELMFWGKDSGKVMAAYPVLDNGNIRADSLKQARKLRQKITRGYDVRVAVLKDAVKCPRCGDENNFDVVHSSESGVLSCNCNGCGVEITNGPCDDVDLADVDLAEVSQEDWDTIVFKLCPR